MALESGAPVIPVAMLNTAEIQPTGQVVPKVRQVEMRFGEPMNFTGDSSDIKLLRSMTDQIMEKIKELSGQEYVDIYASEAKIAIAKARLSEEAVLALLKAPFAWVYDAFTKFPDWPTNNVILAV